MQSTSLVGLTVALVAGLLTGIQATFFTLIGRAIGPARASLVLNLAGGILAGMIVLAAIGIQGRDHWNIPRSAIITATISVAMGMLIITGVSFSFQRMGVGAGIAALFLGQMLIGVIVDTFGRAGDEAIPLDLRRILGLIVMLVAVLLLIPRE